MDRKLNESEISPSDPLADPLDRRLRALWPPAPPAPPSLRARLLAAAEAECKIDTKPRPARAHRWLSRAALATAAAALLVVGIVGARIALRPHRAARPGVELSADDEQFALAAGDDDDSDDGISLLDLAADEP